MNEIKSLLDAARKSRYGICNHLLILLMYRHGLRVSEVINLRVSDINLKEARIWITRLKIGLSVEQPITGDDLRAIKRYLTKRKKQYLPCFFYPNAINLLLGRLLIILLI